MLGIAGDRNVLLLTPFEARARRPRKALLAGAVMLATIAGATINEIGLSLATISGAAGMVLSGCLTPRQAYRAVDARMYLFVAGAIPLGLAMKSTGTADLLARGLQATIAGYLIIYAPRAGTAFSITRGSEHRLPWSSPLPLPSWRQPSGPLFRLAALLLLETVLIVVIFIVVATVVIPIAAPPIVVPTATQTPDASSP